MEMTALDRSTVETAPRRPVCPATLLPFDTVSAEGRQVVRVTERRLEPAFSSCGGIIQRTGCEDTMVLRNFAPITPPGEDSNRHGHGLQRISRDSGAYRKAVAESRASKYMYPCMVVDCSKTFTRSSDVHRHCDTFHNQAKKHFHCGATDCKHHTRRKDKLWEHGQTRHNISTKADLEFIIIDERVVREPRFTDCPDCEFNGCGARPERSRTVAFIS